MRFVFGFEKVFIGALGRRSWNTASVTVYDYRHDEDRVRLQLNDTGLLYTFFPYDTRDPQIQKYLTSIGSNGVYYTRRSRRR